MTTSDVATEAPDDGVPRAKVNGIEIAYETFGRPEDPAILLVMGLGTQMLAWPDQMCELLAEAGHHVIRFDNRDVGLSTHFHDAPSPAPHEVVLKRRSAPYTVSDMANDAVGLLDVLGVERAHVVGASMGGFISQTIALEHPDRVLSLTLIMTSTGSRRVGRPTPKLVARMARRPVATNRDQAIEESVATYRLIGSPDHLDEQLVRELAGRAYDRGYDPMGTQRQLAAILSQPDRTRRLANISVPTLVVHGLEDPLVAASGGLAIAKAIPGATFIGHAGMGHDLPRTLWRTLADDILRLVERVDAEPERGTPGWRLRAAS